MDDTTGPVAGAARYLLAPVSGEPGTELGDRAVIGRMNTCDISIQDKSVSREHARLSRLGTGYLLEDLNSTNGTLVNGNRITEATVIQPGDVLTFGTVEFRLDTEGGVTQGWPAGEALESSYSDLDEAGMPVPASVDKFDAGDIDMAPPAGMATAAPAVQPEEAASPLFEGRTGPGTTDDETDPAGLADEIVSLSGHLSDLAQRLAEAAAAGKTDASATAGNDYVTAIRDMVDSVPASPMTPEELQDAHDVFTGLAANPKDFDLLMRARDVAPQLARMVDQYRQLEAVLNAVADAVGRWSAE